MKARKPGTDQEAEITVLVNRNAATEYKLPAKPGAKPRQDIVECFIPINEGDRITVKGAFRGSVLTGMIDLVVDGSFLSESRIEGKDVKLVNRRIEFKRAVSCPIPPGWTSIESPTDMVEGTLHAKRLDEEAFGDFTQHELASEDCAKPGLGSLQVVISVGQQPLDRYYEKYLDITNGHWRTRDSQLVRKSGILPDYELKLEVEDEVGQKRSSNHRRHWDAMRSGSKPWAKFVFYYRSSDAITRAGCVQRSDKVQDLEQGDAATFVKGTAITNKKQQAEDGVEESNAPAAALSRAPSKMTNTPASGGQTKPASEQRSALRNDPNRRLGGRLSLPSGTPKSPIAKDHGANSAGASSPFATVMREASKRYYPDEGSPSQLTTGGRGDQTRNEPSLQNLKENAPFRAGDIADGKLLYAQSAITSQNGAAMSHAKTTYARDGSISLPPIISAPHSKQTKILSQSTTTDNNLPTSNMASNSKMSYSAAAAADVVDLRQLPTTETIRAAIPDDGVDEFTLTLLYIDRGPYRDDVASNAEFERRKNVVAFQNPDDDQWYKKDMPEQAEDIHRRDSALQNKQASPAPRRSEAPDNESRTEDGRQASAAALDIVKIKQSSPAPRRSEAADNNPRAHDGRQASAAASDIVKIKQEEMDVDAPPQTPTRTPALPSTPQPRLARAKRSTESRPNSATPGAQSPASKRKKGQNLEMKAKLQQELLDKKNRKAEVMKKLKERNEAKEAKRKYDEKQRKREAEEIEELERLNADEDAELAVLEKELMAQDEDEDEEMEENE